MNFEKVKTAIVGCGKISDIYIRNLKELFNITDLIAVSDLDMDLAQQKADKYEIKHVLTTDQILASDEIELVVNLTAPVAHYTVIKQMLESGKHVYTEKMFTTDIDKTKELVEIAEKKNLLIGVSPDTVLGAGLQTAKNVLNMGIIGEVTSGVVSVTRNQNLNSELFRFLQKDGGAISYDVGPYYIGALVSLLGSVVAVKGVGRPSLKHEEAVKGLFNAFAFAIDFNAFSLMHSIFTDDAVISMKDIGTVDPRKLTGYLKMVRMGAPRSLTACNFESIVIRNDKAQIKAKKILPGKEDSGEHIWREAGQYIINAVRTDIGWKISSMKYDKNV